VSVTNIDTYKDTAIKRLNNLIKEIENGDIVGIAVTFTLKDGDSGNMWTVAKKSNPVVLIGEMHCLMADLEFYEVDLRKHSES